MDETYDEMQLTKLETVFIVGIIGCMLFATWELAHLIADEWLYHWVSADRFVRERIVYYSIASLMSVSSILVTSQLAFRFGRFGKTVNRAFLWYGTLLLLSTIAFFVFDCLPEVFAGFLGAGLFVAAIYVVQKRFFTTGRVMKARLDKGKCHACGTGLHADSLFCPGCGAQVGSKCETCDAWASLTDRFCSSCGRELPGDHCWLKVSS